MLFRSERLFFIPGCAAMTPALAARLRGAACVLFDGTLCTDDEMLRAGAGPKTGARMGHMSIAGPAGALAAFCADRKTTPAAVHAKTDLLADFQKRLRDDGFELEWRVPVRPL